MINNDLKSHHAKDRNLSLILLWLRSGDSLNESELFKSSKAQKYYWINKEQFVLKGDVLYKMVHDTDNTLLLVPSTLRDDILRLSHDIPSSGHQGVDRTDSRVKAKYFWYGMSQDVKHYIETCPKCSTRKKTSRKGKCPLTLYHAGEPMERVHIDFLGPLYKSKRGNEYILVMVDQFTKWVEKVPLPSQTAKAD